MADVIELRMNVAALKRFDPYARDIVDSATHVALYTFEDNEWEKTSIEGALFVYNRNGKPFHSMLIMNRLNTNNLIEPVTEGLELQVQEPFLLYRNSKRRIYGIWFYDKDECVRVAARINSLSKESTNNNNTATEPSATASIASDTSKMPPKPEYRTQFSGTADIFSMLSKAQDDYNTFKGINSTGSKEIQAPRAPDVTSQSVMDFFAKAGGSKVALPSGPPAQAASLFRPPAADSHEGPMILQRLMSNPVHSVEHIEKQQRSVTPGDPPNNAGEANKRNNSGFKLKSNAGDSKRKNSQGKAESKSQPPTRILSKMHSDQHFATNAVSDTNGQLENDLSFMRVSSPKAPSPLANFLSQSQPQQLQQLQQQEDMRSAETPVKPALMPPTMFTSSASKAERPALEAPLPPLTPIRPTQEVLRPEPLTRNQLLQAFNYLIKNDADFMNKLHEAYVKSFSELVS